MRVRVEQLGGRRLRVETDEAAAIVDRGPEEGGGGDGFRSTELLMAALGSCTVGTMLAFAENRAIPIGKVRAELTAETADAPKRVTAIRITVTVSGHLTAEELATLERVASRCKVSNTLRASPALDLELQLQPAVPPSPRRPPALVSTQWLAEHLDDPTLVILEVSSRPPDTAPYGHGHIPGSHYAYWKHLCWRELEREFPDSGEMSRRLGRFGVDGHSTVVLVGDPIQFAAYAYWVLWLLGLSGRTVLLDGGRERWIGEGRPLTTERPEPVLGGATRPAPSETDASVRAGWQSVLTAARHGHPALLDLRSPEEYRGERVAPLTAPCDHGAERAGHIPGARHLPYQRLLTAEGTFRDGSDIEALLGEMGIAEDTEIITYCRLSHRAALGWFALTQLAERRGVQVYDGSWTEWGSMVGMPIER